MAYLGEKRLANFRDRGPKNQHKNSERYKERPGMSEEHLALVRQMPCCTCRAKPPGDPHHLKAGTGERGMGVRSTDKWAVPMCRDCHGGVERAGSRNERAWFEARGIGSNELARDLWLNTGDLPKMIKILQAHWDVK